MPFIHLKNRGVFSDGTKLEDSENREPFSLETFYIATDKCTECVGFHDEPQCAAVCPVDCCLPDEDNVETEDELYAKKAHFACRSSFNSEKNILNLM